MTRDISAEFEAHLKTGTTTTCRCWWVLRSDGVGLGFTDHDRLLEFEDKSFEPTAGFNARVLQTGQGLNVDNSEIAGVLSSERIDADDLASGKYDGAEVWVWLVNWQDADQRHLQFRGYLGEIVFSGHEFTAELRSLTDRLSSPVGRSYLKQCDAQLGDGRCRFNLDAPNFRRDSSVKRAESHKLLYLDDVLELSDDWFAYGTLEVLDGANQGATARIFSDRVINGERRLELSEDLYFAPEEGMSVRLSAGCDKQAATCRAKFANIENFQGFPFLPGDDWLMTYPKPKT
ncbi:MAG: DUF2163 domain-containing protein [Pseudomonadota bacterium]